MSKRKRPEPLSLADRQPCSDSHTPSPPGYLDWHAWAERMAKTHKQQRCPECNLWAIWVPKQTGGHRQ